MLNESKILDFLLLSYLYIYIYYIKMLKPNVMVYLLFYKYSKPKDENTPPKFLQTLCVKCSRFSLIIIIAISLLLSFLLNFFLTFFALYKNINLKSNVQKNFAYPFSSLILISLLIKSY
jgi:hypothetical protein